MTRAPLDITDLVRDMTGPLHVTGDAVIRGPMPPLRFPLHVAGRLTLIPPERRLWQVANDLGIGKREAIARLRRLGREVSGHMANLAAEDVAALRADLERPINLRDWPVERPAWMRPRRR